MELLIGLAISMVPVVLCLPLCILLEQLLPKSRVPLSARFPGSIFLVVTPAFVTLLSLPLREIWHQVGIQPLVSLAALNPIMQFAVLLIMIDFLRYLEHRIEHRLWWPVHSVHHAQTDLHAANSYAHPLMAVPEYLVVVIPLSLVDSAGWTPMIAATLVTAFQNLIIHSPLRVHLGSLRRLIVDCRFHRIHHSVEPRHFGRNFGLLFTVWDQFFGTAYFPAEDEWPDVGVEHLAPASSFGEYLLPPQLIFRRRHMPRSTTAASPASTMGEGSAAVGSPPL